MHIALTGKLRSGKSEAANYLSFMHYYRQFAFGDELKADFHRRYPEIPPNPKPRVGYQMHGQLMRRLVGEDVWVRKCFEEIARAKERHEEYGFQPPFRAVITDLRQQNEYDAAKAQGFVIVRINCPDELRLERARQAGDSFEPEDLAHETELYVDTFEVDYDVDNTGTVAELQTQLDEIVRELSRRSVRPH